MPSLLPVVCQALPSLPAHRRLALLTALLGANPSSQQPHNTAQQSLPAGLLLLLKAASEEAAAEGKQRKAQEGQQEQLTQQEPASEWLLELASQLCSQVSLIAVQFGSKF